MNASQGEKVRSASKLEIAARSDGVCSLREAIKIFQLAREYAVPVFTSSSLRFHPGVLEVKRLILGDREGRAQGIGDHDRVGLFDE